MSPYLVCAKSDGMRFVLLCYKKCYYMVDRAFKFYLIRLNFKDDYMYPLDAHNDIGAIFDGELIINKQEKWQYIIHDCINIRGINVSKKTFPERYGEVHKVLAYGKERTPMGDIINVVSKQFFDIKKLKLLERLIEEGKINHNVDGIIFTPKMDKVGSGTQYNLFKWKPRHLHTFDFKVKLNEEDPITFYASKDETLIKFYSFTRKRLKKLLLINLN